MQVFGDIQTFFPSVKFTDWAVRFRVLRDIRDVLHKGEEIWNSALSQRTQKGAFQKSSSNRRNLKTMVLHFSVGRKYFENGAFRKRWRHGNHVIFPTEASSNTNPRCVFKFLRRIVDGKHLMRFRSESSIFKFFRRGPNGGVASSFPGALILPR